MAECDGKSESLQFAVPIGQCGGIWSFLSNQTPPRPLGVATDCDGLPAEQWSLAESEIAGLLELCRSGQPVPLGCRSATGNRRARSCQGAQYLSLSRVRWTSKILMVRDYRREHYGAAPWTAVRETFVRAHRADVLVGPYCYSGTGSSPTPPRGWQDDYELRFSLAGGWLDGDAPMP